MSTASSVRSKKRAPDDTSVAGQSTYSTGASMLSGKNRQGYSGGGSLASAGVEKKSNYSTNISIPSGNVAYIPEAQVVAKASTTTQETGCSTTVTAEDTIHYLSPASGGSTRESPTLRLLHEVESCEEDSFTTTSLSCFEPDLQRTLAIVKPEAMIYKDVILRAVNQSGLQIIRARTIHLTPEQVSEIYAQYYGTASFPHVVVGLSIGPILSLCMAGINAVTKWLDMIGKDKVIRAEWFFPISMRARYGLHSHIANTLHGSEDLPNALTENRYFNPDSILEPLIYEEDKVKDYCNMYVNETLLEGLTEIVKVKPVDPILYLAEWLDKNNPYQPHFPDAVAVVPT